MKAYPRHMINIDKEAFKIAWKMVIGHQASTGDHIARFENDFARFIGAKHAIGVGSARSGLYLILKNLELEAGAEVIMPSYTFHALPVAVLACGYKPVFVDADPKTLNIDPREIGKNINKNTRAIVLTHIFGQPCDMDPIMKLANDHDLKVIEDCAHACGAKYKGKRMGSFGDAAIFSFKMGKNLPCFGGGMLTVNNDALFERIKGSLHEAKFPTTGAMLKNIASTSIFYLVTQPLFFTWLTYPMIRLMEWLRFDWIDSGIEETIELEKDISSVPRQLRLANLQAAVGVYQLQKLDAVNSRRRENAGRLRDMLKDEQGIQLQGELPDCEPTHLYFRVRVGNVNRLRKGLLRRGIDTKRDDMSACSGLSAFNKYKADCPNAERLPGESIEIPCNPQLTSEELDYIGNGIRTAVQL